MQRKMASSLTESPRQQRDDEIVLRDDRAMRLSKRDEDLHHAPLQGLGDAVPFDFAPGGPDAQQPQIEIRFLCQIDAVHPRGVRRRLVHAPPSQTSPAASVIACRTSRRTSKAMARDRPGLGLRSGRDRAGSGTDRAMNSGSSREFAADPERRLLTIACFWKEKAMSCNPWELDRRNSLTGTVALPLCLVLSACGGGGGTDVASIPPPSAHADTNTASASSVRRAMTTIGGYSLVNRSTFRPAGWIPAYAGREL